MTELKPCPFCGKPVKLDTGYRGEVRIHCEDRHYFLCTDEFFCLYGMDEKEKVVEEWNRRGSE